MALWVALVWAGPVEAGARKLATYGNLTAYVPDDMNCSDSIQVWMLGKDRAQFEGDRRALQRLVGGIRAVIGIECGTVSELRITGQVDGEAVWVGVAAETTNWAVISLEQETDVALTKAEPRDEQVPLADTGSALPESKSARQDNLTPGFINQNPIGPSLQEARAMLTSAAVRTGAYGSAHAAAGPSVFP